MKKAIRLIMAVMLCMVLVAQEPEKAEEEGKCGGWLKKCDTNSNGTITCAEARACGLKTPIMKDHPAYNCMNDRDGGWYGLRVRRWVIFGGLCVLAPVAWFLPGGGVPWRYC